MMYSILEKWRGKERSSIGGAVKVVNIPVKIFSLKKRS